MTSMSATPLDSADLGLVEALAANARAELAELAAHVGLPLRRARERIRLLERTGVLRGYHAVTTAPTDQTVRALVLLRFTAMLRPSAEDLSALPSVLRVHTLCAGWHFMLEVVDGAGPISPNLPSRGQLELLGAQADFELLRVLREASCPGGATLELQYEMPPA